MTVRISWFARCPTPYRYPIWDELSTRHDLSVFFLREQGLGRDWTLEPRQEFRQTVLVSRGVRYREDGLWTLMPGWRTRVSGADVVVMQGMWETPAAWQVAWWCRRRRIPMIYFSESTTRSIHRGTGPIAWARSRYLRSAGSVLTPGPAATQAVLAAGVPEDRVVTSVNVIDVERFHVAAAAVRRGCSTSARASHRFLVVARLLERKNVAALVRAMQDARLQTASLDVVGDGPELEGLIALTEALGLSERVCFLGAQDEQGVIERMAVAHTLVLPSTEEVWGLVVNEALAAGLHVVVSDQCGVAETVRSHRGVFVTGVETSSLARGMVESWSRWRGWIEDPEILRHDAVRFVADLGRCVETARSRA